MMSSLLRHVLLLIFLGLAPALAWPNSADHPAQSLVRDTTRAVFHALEEEPSLKEDDRRLLKLVDELVFPHFDLHLMARRVLGKHWRRAKPAARIAFVDQFRRLLVRTYSTALVGYQGQEVRYLPSRMTQQSNRVVVRTAIETEGPVPVSIEYAMLDRKGKWKVYDVVIEGVSLVITYRASFRAEIRKKGIDGLLIRMRNKSGGE